MRTTFLALSLLLSTACGAALTDQTMADLRAPAGDATTCASTQDANGCGPEVACSGTLAACADAGCAIAGLQVVVYPDGSWRAPDPGAGTWAVTRVSPERVRLELGDGTSLLVAEGGSPAYDACQ